MSNIGGAEIFVVLLLALLVLGPERLPKAARQVGGFVRQVRQMSSGFQAEIRNAMDVDDRPSTADRAGIGPAPAMVDSTAVVEDEFETGEFETGEFETDVRASRRDDGADGSAVDDAVDQNGADPISVDDGDGVGPNGTDLHGVASNGIDRVAQDDAGVAVEPVPVPPSPEAPGPVPPSPVPPTAIPPSPARNGRPDSGSHVAAAAGSADERAAG